MNQVWLLREEQAVVKKFGSAAAYENEWLYYRDFPEYTPGIVKLIPEELTIIMRQGNLLSSPTEAQLHDLGMMLQDMAGRNIHHRDVHPGNIVEVDGRVCLIDWETATRHPGRSYDLFGPVDVPVPVQHGGLLPQWWGSNDSGSIKRRWGASIPDWLK